jgi:hypothetical protein
VTIENGPFYLNKQQRLSATQQITIRNAGKIIRELNSALWASILREDAPFGVFEEGDPNIELLEKSAHAKMEYLTLQGQRLRFQCPLTKKNFREIDVNEMKIFRKAGVTFEHKDNLIIVTMGKVKAEQTAVSIPLQKVAFQPNATEAVSKRYGLAEDFDPVQARAKFLKESDARYLKK